MFNGLKFLVQGLKLRRAMARLYNVESRCDTASLRHIRYIICLITNNKSHNIYYTYNNGRKDKIDNKKYSILSISLYKKT